MKTSKRSQLFCMTDFFNDKKKETAITLTRSSIMQSIWLFGNFWSWVIVTFHAYISIATTTEMWIWPWWDSSVVKDPCYFYEGSKFSFQHPDWMAHYWLQCQLQEIENHLWPPWAAALMCTCPTQRLVYTLLKKTINILQIHTFILVLTNLWKSYQCS